MTLTIFNKHSYFNRKIVFKRTLAEYREYFRQEGDSFYDIDFKMLDGINTTQIINFDGGSTSAYYTGDGSASYLVVSDDEGEISSRWWVIESVITRYGQAKLTLLRDVIADNIEEVKSCPAFVEKGWVTTTNDPAIFNNEAMTFNQIKQSEQFIKDDSDSAWFVCYVSKDFGKNKETQEYQDSEIKLPKRVVNTSGSYNTESEYEWSQYTSSTPMLGDYNQFAVEMYGYSDKGSTNGYNFIYAWDGRGRATTPPPHDGYRVHAAMSQVGVLINPDNSNQQVGLQQNEALVDLNSIYRYTVGEDWISDSRAYTGVATAQQTQDLLNENGRLIRVNGVAKRVVVKSRPVTKTIRLMASQPYGQRIWRVAGFSEQFNVDRVYVELRQTITFKTSEIYVELETVEEPEYVFTVPANRQHTRNVPYDIFAIPYHAVNVDTETISTNPTLSSDVVNALQTNIAKELLYDIQIVPYCPLSNSMLSSGVLLSLLPNSEEVINYTKIKPQVDNDSYTFILYASEYEFEKTLDQYTITMTTDPLEYKVANECDMYRLVSPNYNGQFEFSAAKNGGVSAINIAFTYKPYNPYIRVSPSFDRLYGRNFDDARGLLCGGDFSITQVSEAWESYELQNKNYQNIFDRQIQNMEVNNSVQRVKEAVNVGTGTLSGIVGGSTGGAFVGGPYGAIAGGVAGGIASLGGGIADIVLNEKLRTEAMQYQKDQFGYQLQNIKALPYSLTKVGTQNADFKVFPFLEKYSCTETEKQALRDKCRWNGMTIQRIGRISEFLDFATDRGTFIQARPIRLEIIEDSHVSDVINAELRTGVYMT